jgi:hypothetical protein
MLDVPWLHTVVSLKSKMSKQLKKPKAIWVEPVFTTGIEYRGHHVRRTAARIRLRGSREQGVREAVNLA